jgi:hypothetical protein
MGHLKIVLRGIGDLATAMRATIFLGSSKRLKAQQHVQKSKRIKKIDPNSLAT